MLTTALGSPLSSSPPRIPRSVPRRATETRMYAETEGQLQLMKIVDVDAAVAKALDRLPVAKKYLKEIVL